MEGLFVVLVEGNDAFQKSVCDHHGAVIAWWGSDRGVSE